MPAPACTNPRPSRSTTERIAIAVSMSPPTSTYPTCVTFLSLSQMTNRSGSSSPNVGAAATSGVVNSGALSSTEVVARSAGPDAPEPVARSCVETTCSRAVAGP